MPKPKKGIKNTWVEGEGNCSPSGIMLVGESPGRDETFTGRPFMGMTGEEVNFLLNRVLRVGRDEVRLTNMFKYPLMGNKKIDEDSMDMARGMLWDEIEKYKPEIIVTLGEIATTGVMNTGRNMEVMNALPHLLDQGKGLRGLGDIVVVPSFHPAAAFRDTSRMSWIVEAFKTVRRVMDNWNSTVDDLRWAYQDGKVDIVDLSDIKGDVVGLDTETLEDDEMFMLSISDSPGKAAYIMGDDVKGIRKVKGIVGKKGVMTVMHNALFDIPLIGKKGIEVANVRDTMILAFMHQILPLKLKELGYRLLRMKMRTYKEVKGKAKNLGEVEDWGSVEQYACLDPDATLQIYERMLNQKEFPYPKVEEVLDRDMGIIDMLLRMMGRGFVFNKEYAAALEKKLILSWLEKREEIVKLSGGEEFNPGSAPQLSKVLYGKMKLGKGKRIKKTKWGGSTDHTSLKMMEDEHPIIKALLEWKEVETLISKYVSVLPGMVNSDGRIKTHLTLAGAKHSGRLASTKPNLMAQPQRTSEGREIRNCFEAGDGFVLVSLDYSQVEMRLMAHLCRDEKMVKAYRENKDIHSETAATMFRIGLEDVDEMTHRYPAKRTGFGIINNITAHGLCRELNSGGAKGWTVTECEELLKLWFEVYPGVKQYMKDVTTRVRRSKKVVDMWGREELIGEMLSPNPRVYEAGIRKAINQSIQSGAQGIIKEAMIGISRKMKKEIVGGVIYPLLQIHDDLVFEIREDVMTEMVVRIKDIMENCVKLSVPLIVDPKAGKIWGRMEKIKV